ncbi:MAG: hypothetical protein NTY47_00580, partial [Candidatus Omnitrophica bacterium]|nr:hypothetical protein [Candidatus Omnitrophota bacterium]
GLGYASGMGYGHSGAHEGYLTTLFYNPDNDVTYAIFTNIWNCQTFPQSMDSLMDEIKAMSDIANKIIKKIGY